MRKQIHIQRHNKLNHFKTVNRSDTILSYRSQQPVVPLKNPFKSCHRRSKSFSIIGAGSTKSVTRKPKSSSQRRSMSLSCSEDFFRFDFDSSNNYDLGVSLPHLVTPRCRKQKVSPSRVAPRKKIDECKKLSSSSDDDDISLASLSEELTTLFELEARNEDSCYCNNSITTTPKPRNNGTNITPRSPPPLGIKNRNYIVVEIEPEYDENLLLPTLSENPYYYNM